MALFAAFRLPELTRYALWYDELFAITLAQMDWHDLFDRAVADRTNPPLFYALLKLWIGVGGESVAWMRLLPCLLGIAAAVPMVALARRFLDVPGESPFPKPVIFDASVAAMAAAAASPLAVFLSNEIRGYSLLLFASAVSLFAYDRLTASADWLAPGADDGAVPSTRGYALAEHKRRIAQMALAAILLVYSHYFGWLLLAAQVVAAAIWHRRALAGLGIAVGVAILAFSPWALAVIVGSRAVSAPLTMVDWIATPSLLDIPRFFDALVARVFTPATASAGAVAIVASLLALALSVVRRERAVHPRAAIAELAVLAGLPVLVAAAAGLVLARPVFVPRYLLVAAPAWWLLIGAAVVALGALTAGARDVLERDFRTRATVITFVLFTFAAGAARLIRGGEKVAWDQLVAAIAADAKAAGAAQGVIYSLEGFTGLPAAFYAAQQATGLTVQPVQELSAALSADAEPGASAKPAKAWLIVRSSPSGAAAALGAGLAPRGVALTEIYMARVPSHTITAYRLARAP